MPPNLTHCHFKAKYRKNSDQMSQLGVSDYLFLHRKLIRWCAVPLNTTTSGTLNGTKTDLMGSFCLRREDREMGWCSEAGCDFGGSAERVTSCYFNPIWGGRVALPAIVPPSATAWKEAGREAARALCCGLCVRGIWQKSMSHHWIIY